MNKSGTVKLITPDEYTVWAEVNNILLSDDVSLYIEFLCTVYKKCLITKGADYV